MRMTQKKSKRRPPRAAAAAPAKRGATQKTTGHHDATTNATHTTERAPLSARARLAVSALLLAALVWSYWPTLVSLATRWQEIPDYSHGFLVIPIALIFLAIRWDRRPAPSARIQWLGLGLLLLAGALRVAAARYYLEPLDGWTISLWVAGAVALMWGLPTMWWALPSIAFLLFMVPLPYTVERMMAEPLQAISTKMSTFALQSMLFPAFSEGMTIVVGKETLEVARACSGLRIFVGIAALAFATLVFFRRPWWNQFLIVASILPIALIANSARIVATGVLYQLGWGDAARQLSHDMAGWFMIPLAAGLFGLTVYYLDRLFYRTETLDAASLVRQQTEVSSK